MAPDVAEEDDEGQSLCGFSILKESLVRETHQPLGSVTLQSTKYSRDYFAVSIAH